MATNFYFNNFISSQEQTLIDDLIVESIKIYGLDLYYIPRTVIARDDIFSEPTTSSFNEAIEVEMYVRDVQGFTGDGKFLSKFGLEIRDEVTFTCAIRTFNNEVGNACDIKRPREGDLIYFPLNGKAFQIKFVDQESIFYQLGALQVYDIICEEFEWSDEIFNTGYPQIDDKYNALNTDVGSYTILTNDGSNLAINPTGLLLNNAYELSSIDPTAQNDDFQVAADLILDWTERNPFSERY